MFSQFFFEYLLSFPLAACGAEGASQLPHRWLRSCLLGRQGMTSHLPIDIPCLGLACSLNINHRGKVIPSRSRWSRAKASNYPTPPHPQSQRRFLMRKEAELWTICIFMVNSTRDHTLTKSWWCSLATAAFVCKRIPITPSCKLETLHWMLILNIPASVGLYWSSQQTLRHTIKYFGQTLKAWQRRLL